MGRHHPQGGGVRGLTAAPRELPQKKAGMACRPFYRDGTRRAYRASSFHTASGASAWFKV